MTSAKNNPLIIIAHSARALAESAARAGWDVISVDGFADVDTLQVTRSSWCLPLIAAAFDPAQLHTCLAKIYAQHPVANVLLGAGAESLAGHIISLSGWNLCASSVSSIQAINHPATFFNALDALSIEHPQVSYDTPAESSRLPWLFKQAHHCGGLGVQRRTPQAGSTGYWQQELAPAQSISALMLTDGRDSHCLGMNQLHSCEMGERYPYIYAGATANSKVDDKIIEKTIEYADKIINHFKLKGVFSLDMLLLNQASKGELGGELEEQREPQLYVLEVNPRLSASYELYERVNPGLNLVDEHIRVCEGERLSELSLTQAMSAYRIVYAPQACRMNAVPDWPPWCKDRPEQGRAIAQYEPLCSVYADAVEGDLVALLDQREKAILSLIN